MKLYFIIGLWILSSFYFVINAEAPIKKYVWAIDGLNVRSLPSENANIIGVIPYGDTVIVIEETDSAFNVVYIDSKYERIKPLNLNGNWVKIRSENLIGFVFAPYLLEIPSARHNEGIGEYTQRMAGQFIRKSLSTEYTVYHNDNPGLMVFKGHVVVFPNGKEISLPSKKPKPIVEEQEGVGESFYLKGFTLQELLVILNYFYMNNSDRKFTVFEIGQSSVRLTDSTTQTIDIWLYENKVIIFSFEDAGC